MSATDPTPAEPKCEGLAPFVCGNPGCPVHGEPAVPDAGDVDALCMTFHDAYEAAAVEAGWETQERSRKPWAEVPEANKETMRATMRHFLTSDWLRAHVAEVRRETAERVLAGLTDDEASLVDFEMGEHMYRHSISNNINSMGCDVWCRTNGLRRAINKVLSSRIAREDGAR